MTKKKTQGPLTWDELATLYDAAHVGGRRARTMPMSAVFDWAESRTDMFEIKYGGSIYLKVGKKK